MTRHDWTVLCLAYVMGLLATSLFGFPNPHPSWQQWTVAVGGLVGLSLLAAIIRPRLGRRLFSRKLWLGAGAIAIFAVLYFQWRIPQPGLHDISHVLPSHSPHAQLVIVEGKLLSEPKLTRNQRVQVWLEAQQLKKPQKQQVTGKLYLTVPRSPDQNLVEGQRVAVLGTLYRPRAALNPGAFDFANYLLRQGAFAGLKGFKIEALAGESSWGLAPLRKRIIDAQSLWLGDREGALVSSMVLGQKAVDLPYDLRDRFVQAGLAHVLAASGFQVSLLIGATVTLTRRFSERSQLIIGLVVIFLYLGLTGIQPSVLRAGLMGIGALVALVSDRKVRSLGAFLLSATILLFVNPLWIWDLSFQLSFLATLGILVTLPALQTKLDWLPTAIATSIALPIAASLWTLPLILYVFHVVAIYSIPLNIIASPLISIISLGGMLSAVLALPYPVLGSAIAWLLYYPTYLFIEIVKISNALPLASLAVGSVSLGILILIYALIILVWLNQFCQRYWYLVTIFAITLIVIPLIYNHLNLVQITVLATKKEPVLVIRDRGTVTLINSGDIETATYTVLPFLNSQGINQVNNAIAFLSPSSQKQGWSEIEKNIPIDKAWSNLPFPQENFQHLPAREPLSLGKLALQLLSANPPILQLHIGDGSWLLLTNQNILPELASKPPLNLTSSVLLWSGKSLRQEWLDWVKPQVAIAVSNTIDAKLEQQLNQQNLLFYWTGRDGAIQWTSQSGFQRNAEIDFLS
jgi:competence protein ComEC